VAVAAGDLDGLLAPDLHVAVILYFFLVVVFDQLVAVVLDFLDLVVYDGQVAVVADPLDGVVLDPVVQVLLAVDEYLLLVFFVLEPELVEAFPALA